MTSTPRGRKFTYDIINMQLWKRGSATALQTSCTFGFLQKLSTIKDIMKYWIYINIFETVYYRRAFPNTAHP